MAFLPTRRRRAAVAAAIALCVTSTTLFAKEHLAVQASSSVSLEATFSPPLVNGWAKVERYIDNSSGFLAESYPPDGRGDQTAQTETYFGAAEPFSGRFLVYYGPHWNTNTKPTPVLLVTGAGTTPDHAWANPDDTGAYGCGVATCPVTGLMQYLDALGYKVFAVGFPHKNGDNYYWSEQIYDSIQVIKAKTGASQVNLVGWSKGAFASRMYLSSLRKTWGTAYAGDVAKYISIGGGNKGFDWPFRHGVNNVPLIWPECGGTLNGAAPVTDFVCNGIWYHHPELSFWSNNFPGSGQLIARWDSTYALPTAELDDSSVYFGGTGSVSIGQGIQSIINQQSLVQPLINAGVPASVPVYDLCGGDNTLPFLHNEHTGPSDGAVFVASCTATDGVGNTAATNVNYSDNHLELGWDPTEEAQIVSWLG